MGMAKRMMEEAEDRRRLAEKIAVESGALAACEFHGTIVEDSSDEEAAVELAERKYPNAFADKGKCAKEIKEAISAAALSCGLCDKIAAE